MTNNAERASMSVPQAIAVAVRELRRRRQSIQRRKGASDPRYAELMLELATAITVLEAFAQTIETAT
jgi:hypothetical protein